MLNRAIRRLLLALAWIPAVAPGLGAGPSGGPAAAPVGEDLPPLPPPSMPPPVESARPLPSPFPDDAPGPSTAPDVLPEPGPRPRLLPAPGGLGLRPEAIQRSPWPGVSRLFRTPVDPTLGFAGKSGVRPGEGQTTPDFVPVEDRWRIGFPEWDRYGQGHPLFSDYPYMPGRILDPFNQNVLKGDYPILGQHTFADFSVANLQIYEFRNVPTQTTPFESTARPFTPNFVGRTGSFFTEQYFAFNVDLFHGDAGFRPVDWRIVMTPTFNVNNFAFNELAQVSPNVLQGTNRTRTFFAMEQMFAEFKIADVSSEFDTVNIRAGTQPFISDFRGFLFADINRAVRIFGTRNAERDQYNLAYFRQWEKDTNSFLNTFNDRRQNLVFANYYRQDFLIPGYTAQVSLNYDNDPASFKFDKNRFLVRPDPVGVFKPHSVNVGYLGIGGDGHFGRLNVTNQFYWAFGYDSLNPLANRSQTINAQMAAIEASYDRDWMRFRMSFFWSSGDHNINNAHATGFDTILDAPNFAGGPFSYWNRQIIPLFGVNLTQRLSLVPDLRSSKIQGQANFVNPGLLLPTLGVDFNLTQRLRWINNFNLIWFDSANVLEQFLYQGKINRFVGGDLSTGMEYRPLLNEGIVFVGGVSVLVPGQGFHNLYNNFTGEIGNLAAGFLTLSLVF